MEAEKLTKQKWKQYCGTPCTCKILFSSTLHLCFQFYLRFSYLFPHEKHEIDYLDICIYICLCVCMSDMSQMSSKYRVSHNIVSTFVLLISRPSKHLEVTSWTFFNSPLHVDLLLFGAILTKIWPKY